MKQIIDGGGETMTTNETSSTNKPCKKCGWGTFVADYMSDGTVELYCENCCAKVVDDTEPEPRIVEGTVRQ